MSDSRTTAPPDEAVPPRPPWAAHAGLFVAAGALCVLVRLAFPGDVLTWDDTCYLQAAEQVAAGSPDCFTGHLYMHHRIGLVLPMAAAIRLFGENLFSYWLVATGYAFLAGGFCYLVGRRLAGWPVGVAAAAMLAAHPISVTDGSRLLPDHALNAWITMAVWAALHTRTARGARGRLAWGAAAGLMLFGSYATRETFVFLLPAVLLAVGWRRCWPALAGLAAAFAAGWVAESWLHLAFSGDWFNRLHSTESGYEHWVQQQALHEGWQDLFARWGHPFLVVYGWRVVTLGSALLAAGGLIVGGWRGRLLGTWFLVPTLLILFGVRSLDPPTPLMHPNVPYLAMPASAATILLAWSGAGLSRRLAPGRPKARAALQAAGTALVAAASIWCLVQSRQDTSDDPGHPWRIAAEIDREYALHGPMPVYANRWSWTYVRLLADDRAKPLLRDSMSIIEAGDDFPSDCLVLLDKYGLARADAVRFQTAGSRGPASRPAAGQLLSPRVARPPSHWQLLAVGLRSRYDWYLLYHVHRPGERCLEAVDMYTGNGFWTAGDRSLAGWHCYPSRSRKLLEPLDSPLGPGTGLRLHRDLSHAAVYLMTGRSAELGNLKGRLTPREADRFPVDPDKLYQVRFLARLNGDAPAFAIVRLWEFGPQHVIRRSPVDQMYRVVLTPTTDWQAASLAFRVDPRTRWLRIGFTTVPDASLDLADVQLVAYEP